jgi:hypothetical protein
MMWARRAVLVLLALLPAATALPAAARADAPEAAALESDLRDWLLALLGPQAGLGARPVQVVAQGDAFALTVPVAGPLAQTPLTLAGPPATATLRRLDGGRWALDDIRLPTPLRVTVPGRAGESVWTATTQDQDQHAVLDPTLTTTSTWDGTVGGYATAWHGPEGERQTEAAHVRSHLVWQPAGGGRVDLAETASSDLLASNARMARAGLVSFSAARSQLALHIDGLAPDRLAALLHAVLAGAATADAAPPAPPGHRRLSPAQLQVLLAALDAAGGLLGGFGEQVRLADVHLAGNGLDMALRAAEFGLSAAAPDGRLRLRLHVALDGIDSGRLPQGPLRAFVPRRLALTPRLSGISLARVTALLRDAVEDPDNPMLTAEAAALAQDGPLTLGLDDLALDLGQTRFTASGEVQVAAGSGGGMSGQARISATGLDALIHDVQAVPQMQPLLPTLLFLKGLGEIAGEATVWNVEVADGHVRVNGTDLGGLLPGR